MAELHSAQLVPQRLLRQSSTSSWTPRQRQLLDAAQVVRRHVQHWQLPPQKQTLQTQQVQKGTRGALRSTDERLRWFWDLPSIRSQVFWLRSLPLPEFLGSGTLQLHHSTGRRFPTVSRLLVTWVQNGELANFSIDGSGDQHIFVPLLRQHGYDRCEPSCQPWFLWLFQRRISRIFSTDALVLFCAGPRLQQLPRTFSAE